MRIFVTGAAGFIGSTLVPELLRAGHQVLGLTRSEASAQSLIQAGAEAHRGDLDDLESLRRGAALCDGIIHTAFNHDFSRFVANCEADRQVILAMGSVFAGSDRPLVITSTTGTANVVPGQPALEDNPIASASVLPRAASEEAALALMQAGVHVSVVRLPQVHSPVKQGLITDLIKLARQQGVSAFVGEGQNRWPATHVSDAARLYRLALEKQEAGGKYHAVAEEGIALRDIAEVIGRGLKVPVVGLSAEEARSHFGWLHAFVSRDLPASSALTRERLGWQPTGPGLIADLAQMRYAEA